MLQIIGRRVEGGGGGGVYYASVYCPGGGGDNTGAKYVGTPGVLGSAIF